MAKIELDDRAVAYSYVATNPFTGDVEATGVELPINIMRIYRSLTAELLEVEITPLYVLPEELKDSKDFYAD